MIRSLRRPGRSPGAAEKVVLAILLVPPFGVLLVLLRLLAVVHGPVQVQAVTSDGLRFRCDLPDLIQTYLYLFDVWEPDLTAYMRRTLRPGDGFIDIGANIGYFTLLTTGRIGPGGSTLAIEASPRIYGELLRNIELNGGPRNIRAVNLAAADRRGVLSVFLGPDKNIGLTTTVPGRGFVAEAEVAAAPLADIAHAAELDNARLIKIDVEGGEPTVLAGVAAVLERLRSEVEIMVELSPQWWKDGRTVGEVLRPFLAAGFHPYAVPNNYWPWRYLWPDAVTRPTRLGGDLAAFRGRVDIVLSRRDVDQL